MMRMMFPGGLSVATLLGGLAFLSSGEVPFVSGQPLISSAYAIIGRPLTPMSYAGVARRTTRRAYGVGVVAAPVVVVAPVRVAPVCTQAVDIYGRIYTRC
jgi:hypothetical protein